MSRDLFTARVAARARDIDALMAAFEGLGDPAPLSVSASERAEDDWLVEALYAEAPDPGRLEAWLGRPVQLSVLADENWVKRALDGLPPVRIGRFAVFGAHDRARIGVNAVRLEIEASLAFGTGHHGTTAGCLRALDRLLKQGRPARALDVGCGTGVLALALAKATRRPVHATDIDPVAVRVTRANARAAGARPLVTAVAADGLRHRAIRQAAPFDLILANILARPLVMLASQIVGAAAPGATLVLSGLLTVQAPMVFAAYRDRGCRLLARDVQGEWTTLLLRTR